MKRFLFSALGCWLACAAQAAVPPAEKLLPEDTQFVMSIPDFGKARAFYEHSPGVRLWQDPAMLPFKAKLWGKISGEMFEPMEKKLGVWLTNYTSLPQGQITFAVLPDATAKDEGMVVLLDTRDKSPQLATALADLRKRWVDAGKALRTEKIRNVEFAVISPGADDAAKPAKEPADGDAGKPPAAAKDSLYIGQSESLLIITSSARIAEGILTAQAGAGSHSLEELPAFARPQGTFFRNAIAFAWFNPKSAVAAMVKQDEGVKEIESDSNPMSFKWAKVAAVTGLSGLQSAAFAFSDSPEGIQATGFLGVPESARVGFFKILAGEPKDAQPPAFVPADAVQYVRWRLDARKSWDTLLKMIGDINPLWLNQLKLAISMGETSAKEKDPEFSIEKNFIGNMGDDFIAYSKAAKGATLEELAAAPSLTLIASPKGEQLPLALKSIFALFSPEAAGGGLSEREFRGHKIYSLKLPAMPGVPGAKAPAPTVMSYCAAGGYLALSADAGILEEYLRSSENPVKSLREKTGLPEALQKVLADGTSMVGYSNQTEEMRAVFEMLRHSGDANSANATGAAASLAGLAGLPNADKLKEWFDPSLLPAFDQVAKYLGFSVYTAGANQEGLIFKMFSPTPPQLIGK